MSGEREAGLQQGEVLTHGGTVLGIESTCDETAAAVICDGELVSNVVASSMLEHARYGGVIPEIASRAHAESFVPVVSKALADANLDLSQVDAI
ncbi:MAG: hypothetical protein L0K03_08350, partial [Bifidobacterium crudilactis]|nr:hypothetical protein [Bifidobacterium crudilactis]